MEKRDVSISKLVDMIDGGVLRLPELQRQFVWTASRVRDLFDSLYRGYPSGMILVWSTDEGAPEKAMAVEQQARPAWEPTLLLLDGQQRLTSLTAIMRTRPLVVRGRARSIDLAFNLEHPEEPFLEVADIEYDAPGSDPDQDLDDLEDQGPNGVMESIRSRTFVVATKALLADPRWVNVSEVFDPSKPDSYFLRRLGLTSEDERWDLFAKRLQKVRAIANYPYVMNVLERGLAYPEVAEIFVRVNSLGTKLRGSDLALAQITARWKNSLAKFDEFVWECENHGFNLDLGLIVRGLVVFATQRATFDTASRIPVHALQSAWEREQDAFRFALDFLRQNAGVENEGLLSSPLLVIPVAVFASLKEFSLSPEDQNGVLQWLLVANAFSHYAGSSETRLNADLAVLFRDEGPVGLMALLKRQFGRSEVSAEDFVGRSKQSGLFPTTFLALRHAGARDWGTGLRISVAHQGRKNTIEDHHIFPKKALRQEGIESALTDEISNLAFLSSSKNRTLGTKPPETYLPLIVESSGEAALTEQAIPTNPELWRLENFQKFLVARRALLANAVNDFLTGIASGEQPIVDPEALIEGEESRHR